MTPENQKIIDEMEARSKSIWNWGHAHTFAAGMILAVIADRLFMLVFF